MPPRLPAALVLALLTGLLAALLVSLPASAEPRAADPVTGDRVLRPGQPSALDVDVVPGRPALRVAWAPPDDLGGLVVAGYEVLLDDEVVARVGPSVREHVVSEGLLLGRAYRVGVRALGPAGAGTPATEDQVLHVAPVTTVQEANPDNPLAGVDWGVYLGRADPAYNGWVDLDQETKDRLAPIAMISKAKYFGKWIPDASAYRKTREYLEASQDGDPDTLTLLTLFRMYPWEGDAWIAERLPTAAEQASYRRYVRGVAEAIGDDPVAVVLQPDGYFAKKAYDAWLRKAGRRKALLPSRMLAWTAETLAALPRTTVYVDMGSEDWARGDVAAVARFLRLCGVEHARGFSLNVSHKNYLAREIRFAKRVSRALARMGLPGKHAVLDTSDNGQPFHGKEINPQGSHTPDYTPPGDIGPCRTKDQRTPCTALGIPPTTDVDSPAWGLRPRLARTAARYVDAYLWVSRPWLPGQGRGGTTFSPAYAARLLETWEFSPYLGG